MEAVKHNRCVNIVSNKIDNYNAQFDLFDIIFRSNELVFFIACPHNYPFMRKKCLYYQLDMKQGV